MNQNENNEQASGRGRLMSRRQFVKAAGATAAGVVIGATAKSPVFSLSPGQVIGANDRIGVGIIGCGGQGCYHITALSNIMIKANAFPVAVCDVYEKRKNEGRKAAQLPESKGYGDYRELLENKDVDAVIIATPEHWHTQIAMDAMEAGKHCYIEKPMTRHLDEALRLRDVALRTKRTIQIGCQACSDPKWTKANELIRQGRIGRVVWSQASYCRNSREGEWNYPIDSDASESNLDWRMWLGSCPKRPFDPERYFRWRKYADYSAGILSDMFPHRLHPLLLAIGPEFPKKVACLGTMSIQSDREVPDTTHVMVEFPSGHTVIVAGSTANEQGLQDVIRGHHATMYLGGSRIDVKPERPYSDEMEAASVETGGPSESLEEHQRDFLSCIRTGKIPTCGLELGVKVQAIISLAEMAYRQGKTVSFDTEKLEVV